MDPYKVLGVGHDATPEEIKKKYRELVKRYHPDRVAGTPQAKAYEEKLKQINEAYDLLTKDVSSSNTYMGGYDQSSQGKGYYSGAYSQQFARVRQCINANNLSAAESILDAIPVQNAEWHFLKGMILLRRGWYDGARQHFAMAYNMDPTNPEYAAAYNQTAQSGYTNFYGNRSSSTSDGGMDCCRICACMMCMDACCSVGSCC